MKHLLSALLCSLPLAAAGVATAVQAASPQTGTAVTAVTASAAQQAAMQLELTRLIAQFGDGIAGTYSENPARIVYGNFLMTIRMMP